tara:strand:+ start:686 stop:1633 length:948 start_codon:yes stop_codon:yes gene_type:complete
LETFEQFMTHCLHDPVKGYYARNIQGIGNRGDFTTAPQISQAPAAAIASWAACALRKTGCRHLIEVGPGLGTLAKDVFRKLPLTLRLRTSLHLVESSPALSRCQKNLLKNRAYHHSSIHSALEACQGNAVIYSNELVDAFPVRLFQKTDDGWQEIALAPNGDLKKEILLATGKLPSSSIFQRKFAIGQRVEIHDSYRLWLESWLPHWKKGEMLTIDYGDTVDRLYHRQPRGSLRAYLLHQRLEGEAVYGNPGMQDITADVNFTDLVEWSEPWMETPELTNFADFIRPFSEMEDPLPAESASYFQALKQQRITNPP